MIYEKNMTAGVLRQFMKQLIKDAGRKVFVVLDNLRVHQAKLVKAKLVRHNKEIEVFNSPPIPRI